MLQPREGWYFEDLHVGQRFTSASHTLDEAQVLAFAREYDPQPFHLSDAGAAGSLFGTLAASGWHTAALTIKLLVTGGAPIAGGLIGAGGELAWPRPTRPGDTLHVESVVRELVGSRSRADRGWVTLHSETLNQRGEPVLLWTARLVVPRRGAQA